MKYILDYLKEYCEADYYPLHMPGHKRSRLPFPNPYGIDITEIEGFDNLHHAEGILKDAQERAAKLYGSKQCFYLVNGSTCGLLAAICAATKKHDRVIVARNCHKAVYHALYLNELEAEYLYPAITENGIQGQITVEQVREALAEYPDATAVILTSPTYEGILSDVKGIAGICHAAGIPLIVDEAHGAHFGFGGGFPENAVRLGADAVIMSVHKTLPAFTQTALLHLNSDRISEEKVKRYLGIFETSSPSYVLMAGIDESMRLIKEHGESFFASYRDKLDRFYEKVSVLQKLHVMNKGDLCKQEAFAWDDSKLVIFTGRSGLTGEELHRILLEEYHLEMELVSGYYVLGMTSFLDTEEGLNRLAEALIEIDSGTYRAEIGNEEGLQEIQETLLSEKCSEDAVGQNKVRSAEGMLAGQQKFGLIEKIYQQNPRIMQMHEAEDHESRLVPLTEAVGRVAAGTIFLYPPGIPMIIPGERITESLIRNIIECKKMGLLVEGDMIEEKVDAGKDCIFLKTILY